MTSLLKIAAVKEVVPASNGAEIVVKADVLLGDTRSELEIAVTTDLAASVAIALLATTAQSRAERDGLMPALEVLAAAVVASGSAEKVRVQLLFDKGTVLPVEMPASAAAALKRDLLRGANAAADDPAEGVDGG